MNEFQVLTLADFQDNPLFQFDGAGHMDAGEVDQLNKALGTGTTGEAYGDYASGNALMPQSLEGTLKTVLASDKHLKISKQIAKKTAWNTMEEYNRVLNYGGDASAFFVDGGLPNEQDSEYERKAAFVKFMGTTRTITHGMTLVRNAHGDIVARESNNGTQWIMQQLERAIFFGDSSMDKLAFDGIEVQVRNAAPWNVIDLKGQPLDETVLNQATRQVAEQYGFAEKLYGSIATLADTSEILYPRQRTGFPAAGGGNLGNKPNGFEGHGGSITFEPDVFLRAGGAPKTLSSDGAPAAPAGGVTPLAAGADTTSRLVASTYYYWVASVNSKGESTPVALGSIVIPALQSATLAWTRVTASPAARSYKLYRGTTNVVADALFFKQVADATTGTEQTYVDRNFDMPGTDTAFMLDMDEEQSLAFKQLAPIMKLPLARISAAERFMILLYGMPIVYNPMRNIVFKNIGHVSNPKYPVLGSKGYSASIPQN